MSGAPELLGAVLNGDGSCSFLVWAPHADRLVLHLHAPVDRLLPLERDDFGYHRAVVPDSPPGTRYSFRFPDGRDLPDPASRSQPDGVHAPSQVVARDHDWMTASWQAPTLDDMVLYELHVGTFTPEGTFDAVIPRLPALRELGVNCVELMPIAEFPGRRNWGYDGVYAFAAQSSYGGPAGLKRLVDAAHALDIGIALDVVYNHLGPEGNYLPAYGPYFTETYHTPWGAALNFDEADSDHVRRYFIESALQWTSEFRIDVLRIDAVHAIFDRSAQPFLRELARSVHDHAAAAGRVVTVIAESDLSDPRVVRSERFGGLGMDAQWLDDLHHALRAVLTGERRGYYIDYGTLDHLAAAYQRGYVYTGQYSRFRRRRHGALAADTRPQQFVVYAQNHDQVGNRMLGDRLATQVTADRRRLAAAAVLLSPFTPLLFMGDEYGESSPFPYFVSLGDAGLVDAVRNGRRAEFESFDWDGEPPDPQAESTFRSAVLDWDRRTGPGHGELLALHRRLLELRRSEPALRAAESLRVDTPADGVLVVRRSTGRQQSMLLMNFSAATAAVDPETPDGWRCALDTADAAWGGPGTTAPESTAAAGTDASAQCGIITLAPWSAVLLLSDEG